MFLTEFGNKNRINEKNKYENEEEKSKLDKNYTNNNNRSKNKQEQKSGSDQKNMNKRSIKYEQNENKEPEKEKEKEKENEKENEKEKETNKLKNLTPKKEGQLMKKIENKSKKVDGKNWYLINYKWWTEWKQYTSYDFIDYDSSDDSSSENESPFEPEKPKEIDNRPLLNDENELKTGLSEYLNYHVVCREMWTKLEQMYGGGPEIPRKIIKHGLNKNKMVEVYPLSLSIIYYAKGKAKSKISLSISRSSTIQQLVDVGKVKFAINKENVYLFDYFHGKRGREFTNFEETISESYIMNNSHLLISTTSEETLSDSVDGTNLSSNYTETLEPNLSSFTNSSFNNSTRYLSGPSHKGCTGLNNLGNTCFMNSGLQCLLHTVPLIQYFFNEDNSIEMGGKLASAFGNLVKEYWEGKSSAISPTKFKHVIGQFSSQIKGFSQQDPQELISLVLDGLHKDLNGFLEKNLVETLVQGELTEEEFANESWKVYKQRNDSKIVDLFQGQLKNKLTCISCKEISINFDPYMYLSLPIPGLNVYKTRLTLIFKDGTKSPVAYGIISAKKDGLYGILSEVSRYSNIPVENLKMAEIFQNRINTFIDNDMKVQNIEKNDTLVVYEVDNFDINEGEMGGQMDRVEEKEKVDEEERGKKGDDLENSYCFFDENYQKKKNHKKKKKKKKKTIYLEIHSSAKIKKAYPLYKEKFQIKDEIFGIPRLLALSRGKITYFDLYQKIKFLLENLIPTNEYNLEEGKQNFARGESLKENYLKKEENQRRKRKRKKRKEERKEANFQKWMKQKIEKRIIKKEKKKKKKIGMQIDYSSDSSDSPTEQYYRKKYQYNLYNFYDYNNSSSDENETSDENINKGQNGNDKDDKDDDDDDDDDDEKENKLYSKCGFYTGLHTPFFNINYFEKDKVKEFNEKSEGKIKINKNLQIVLNWYPNLYLEDDNFLNLKKKLNTMTPHESYHSINQKTKTNSSINLSKCIGQFVTEEKLGINDKWYCPKCQKHVQAMKKIDIWSAPEILIFQLQRFRYDTFSIPKIATYVDFPEEIDLSKYIIGKCKKSPKYRLYGVSNHYGGYRSSHYTAYAKNPTTQKWYEYDDSSVSSISGIDEVKSSAAYVLFYRRIEDDDMSIKNLDPLFNDFSHKKNQQKSYVISKKKNRNNGIGVENSSDTDECQDFN
ncbi:ubiquitin carboxyl-terminal hydrolase [Anaeramoeba flamelloides]|uniref:Ubiquitin carboxyl-terminal hydrolase n=1 Tax=Anaeramoeba flamelloides TaxID=1746091 RepID=A0AAV7ZP12_9EUKA|nr:ubiquitin carboxyl-terminal hydrolase [Anaeramoeba flamelloides]